MSTNDVYKRALEKIAGWDASNSTLRAGEEITLHISNLMSAPGQPLPA